VVDLLKRIISYVLASLIVSMVSLPVFADEQPQTSAKSAVLINADNLQVLYAKDENSRRPMASTTKIMTALITLEKAAVNDKIVSITDEMVRVEGSSMGLLPGDQVTLKTLAIGMLTVSGNDAANSAAIAISGSTAAFSDLMNQRAKELHLNNSHFVTPSGLDDKEHYTTALDLAVLTAAALKNSDFAGIVCQKLMNVQYVSPDQTRRLTNHNKLLNMYEGCTGVKTGFTDKSGRCLVSSAERNGIRLIAVTLNDPNDWDDHKKMMDYGFSQLVNYQIDDSSFTAELPVVGGLQDKVDVSGTAGSNLVLSADDSLKITRKVLIPKFTYAPVEKDQVVGAVRYVLDGKTVATTEIVAKESVAKPIIQRNVFEGFIDNLKKLFMI
jgi:D-alanyl-D-alanine carboxypeptidase/D-alanyl-D-alanine carboxypeptidase (penicillin-binding protein 5/6)